MRNKNKRRAPDVRPIVYTVTRNAVTIKLQGTAFANLKAIADAMNATGWCDTDNTPATALHLWVGGFLHDTAEPPKYYHKVSCGGISDVCEGIIDSIDTDAEYGSEAERVRHAELRKQFATRNLVIG